ncbi:hypothetical protein ACEN9H_27995 [Massilia cellulosiltytica]
MRSRSSLRQLELRQVTDMVAAIGSVVQAPDPYSAAREFVALF